MNRELPRLKTERLLLRPMRLSDAPRIQELAGEREIASTTKRVPHPYVDGVAEAWIETHGQLFAEGKAVFLAVAWPETDRLVGTIGLEIDAANERGELGYWIGKPFWGRGFCTEAAGELLRYGFEELNLQRVVACHFARNPASGRVMAKLGMKHEGVLRRHIKKWGVFEDYVVFGLLREEFVARWGMK